MPDVNVLVYAHFPAMPEHARYAELLASLAIEHGCEWLSADGDFARFRGLRWRHPMRDP